MRNEISTEVMKNKEVFNALAQNTFKGLDAKNIPQALLEGMMRGHTIQDFMIKDVYALPFWNAKDQKQDYSLVTSISKARKIAMHSGQSGKSEPEFKYKADGSLLSCKVTVWKVGGDERGYSALVMFDEYEKPAYKRKDGTEVPGMWQTKSHTMIAKVAEMHALRMAFPEELSQMYVEEEFEREAAIQMDAVDVVPPEKTKEAIDGIGKQTKLEELQEFFSALGSDVRKEDEVIEAYKAKLEELKTPAKPKATPKK